MNQARIKRTLKIHRRTHDPSPSWQWRRWIAGIIGSILVIASLYVISFQVLSTLVNGNDKYQQSIKDYLIQQSQGSTSIEGVRLGWKSIFPTVYLDEISWSNGLVSYATAALGSVNFNPLAYFYGGSVLSVNLRQGDFVISNSQFTKNFGGNIRLENMNLDLRIEDFKLAVKDNNALFVSLDKQIIRLRQGKIKSQARGNIGYGTNQVVEFSLSIKSGYRDDALYIELNNMVLDYGWQRIIAGFELPNDIQNFSESVNAIMGSGQLWVDLQNLSSLSIKTKFDLKHFSLGTDTSTTKQINLDNTNFVGSFSLNDDEQGMTWELMIKDFDFDLQASDSRSRRLSFGDIQINREADFTEIISAQIKAEDASYLAVNVLSEQNIINNISAYDANGKLQDIYIRINDTQNSKSHPVKSKFIMDAKLDDVTTQPVDQIPSFISTSGELAIRDTKGWFLLDDEDMDLFLPYFYPEPFHFGDARAIFMWEWIEPGELLLVGSSDDIRDGDLWGAMEFALHSIPDQHGYIDLEVGMQNADIQQSRSFIPWRRLRPGTGEWLNRSLAGGQVLSAALSMRGDVKDFGSPQALFELAMSVADGELLYQNREEPIKAPIFDIFVDADEVKVILPQGGNIGDFARIDKGYGWVDIDTGHFSLGGEGDIYLKFLPSVLSNYLLDGETLGWNTSGVAKGDWEFQYNLINNEFEGADFNLATSDGQLILPGGGEDYKMSDISGEIHFSRKGYSGDWTAYFDNNKLEANFIDNSKGNGLQVSGILSVPDSLSQIISINGSSLFNFEAYTKERGNILFSDYEITSDLSGMTLDLPYPLNKPAGTIKPLVFIGEKKDEGTFNSLAMGTDLRISWRTEIGSLTGIAVNIPHNTNQPLSRQNNVAKGIVLQLSNSETIDLNQWQQALNKSAFISSDSSQVAGSANVIKLTNTIHSRIWDYSQRFPYWDININSVSLGDNKYRNIKVEHTPIINPWIEFYFATEYGHNANGRFKMSQTDPNIFVDLYSLSIKSDKGDHESTNSTSSEEDERRFFDYIPKSINPPTSFAQLPSMDIEIQSIFYDDKFIGNFKVTLNPKDYEMKIVLKDSRLMGVKFGGEIMWSLISDTRSKLSFVLDGFGNIPRGYINGLSAESLRVHIDWQWEGINALFAEWEGPNKPSGSLNINSGRGKIVSDRVNILTNIISFLNIDNLGTRLAGDLSDLSADEISYRNAALNMDISGFEYMVRDRAIIVLSFMTIEAEGSYNLKDDDLDMLVTVTSPTTKVLPLTALLLGASALTPLLLSIDIAGGEFINRFSSATYQIEGTFDNPKSSLAKIGDVSGRNLAPDELLNQADVKSRLDGLRF